MITRIEIDGFKMFQDFTLDLEPVVCVVGANAVGKSNLFDVLRLLSRLADNDLRTAFQSPETEREEMRGEAYELFTIGPDGVPLTKMRCGVELLVEPSIRDSWGAEEQLTYTRMRYELEIERRKDDRGLERLYVTHERLAPIFRDGDSWATHQIRRNHEHWIPSSRTGRMRARRKEYFISTSTTQREGVPTISLHQDGHGGRKSSVAERIERTMLSGVTNTEFPHALAAREEMRSWRFLQLNPRSLRQPSSMSAQQTLAPDGSFLPSTLARLKAENSYILHDVARDLGELVSGITTLEIEEDASRNRYVMYATTQDGRRFSSRLLSDGTLRLLALITLKNDPEYRGVLCFEEPENGIHPARIHNTVQLLRDLATHFDDDDAIHLPLRQMLVNTHSPVLMAEYVKQSTQNGSESVPGLLFAYTATRVHGKSPDGSMRITRMAPVTPQRHTRLDLPMDEAEQMYTLGEVERYLSTVDPGEALDTLKPGRSR